MYVAMHSIPREIVDCIGDARTPTPEEEIALAARIWTETGRDRTQLAPAAWDRLMSLRIANAALHGSSTLR